MGNILILKNDWGYVASSLLPQAGGKIDIMILKKRLEALGHCTEVVSLEDLRFPTDYKGWYVIYPSSEDAGLFYKEFIEDILIRLLLDGVVLLPGFEYFRAHHNKVFMECLRTRIKDEGLKTIQSWCFYSCENAKRILKKEGEQVSFPLVVKTSSGAGSAGVILVHNQKELIRRIQKLGKISFSGGLASPKKKLRWRLGKIKRKILGIKLPYQTPSREKMIMQTFIPNLKCDYKVLVFGEKYYILRRKVRNHDFRASGSGKLEFPENMTKQEYSVLDLAKRAYEEFDNPFLSIDIAFDGMKCHMIEFQCLNFGPYTLQYSNRYYKYTDHEWKEIKEASVLEIEMANAIDFHIKKCRKGTENIE